MDIVSVIWIFVQVLIGCQLVVPILLFLVYKAKRKRLGLRGEPASVSYDYGIIVTAYEETALIPRVIESLLRLNYRNYVVYVVADNCDLSTIDIDDPRVVLLRPPETLASNVASHLYAIDNFVRSHELIAVVDSDNIVHPDFLTECNRSIAGGYAVVQGVRLANNMTTHYAALDAARDIYYHFYDGEVLFALGSSATLAGSGMAMETSLYVECMGDNPLKGAGFDKVLQAEIVWRGYRIAFNPKAIVYDEKTAQADQLVNQRARWINTWFKYAKLGLSVFARGIVRRDINQSLFGFILLRPPLFIFLALSIACMSISFFIEPIHGVWWLVALSLFVLGFFLALLHHRTDKSIYRSLFRIPLFMFYQFVALLHSRRANKRSVATKHSQNAK